ncbi:MULTISPECIES: hypothetical protein [Pseudomonadota]|uniref:hypothetical protein n=3 Tax=Pseudomonadota TaxID=1224 RepID=UPI00076A74F4|nr:MULTISPECIES: hypothetical protein [Pseudomonadota]
MFYKFVGGDEPALLDIFDKAVENGSLKFTSALGFNDPFEFKFNSIAPTREAFDAWHKRGDYTKVTYLHGKGERIANVTRQVGS